MSFSIQKPTSFWLFPTDREQHPVYQPGHMYIHLMPIGSRNCRRCGSPLSISTQKLLNVPAHSISFREQPVGQPPHCPSMKSICASRTMKTSAQKAPLNYHFTSNHFIYRVLRAHRGLGLIQRNQDCGADQWNVCVTFFEPIFFNSRELLQLAHTLLGQIDSYDYITHHHKILSCKHDTAFTLSIKELNVKL